MLVKHSKKLSRQDIKKLKHRAGDRYAGLTERQIRHVTSNNSKYRIHSAVFKNKVLPKPVRAKHVDSQHQIDLIDLTKQSVEFAGKVLSAMDVFSRYLWLAPLEKKSSRCIVRNLQKIYEEQGPLVRLQSDRGKELYGL